MAKITYVTGNAGKFDMVKNYLATHFPITLAQANIPLIEEQHLDLQTIAISKAKQAWSALKTPVLVDDAGAYFYRYHQFPGSMTKFVYQALGFEGLYRLYDVGDKACFITYLVYMYDDNAYDLFKGMVEGILIKPPLSGNSCVLPYTYLIIPSGQTKTIGQLEEAAGYSLYDPRIMALQTFITYYKAHHSY
jgi:XTP/dITP diphosphohydrolase